MKGVLLSDCLYMVKNSTYTGVNNIVPYNPFVKDLKNALWAGETEKAQQALGQILEATLSFYHEYHEYSYHLILNGFFTGQGASCPRRRPATAGAISSSWIPPAGAASFWNSST